MRLKWSQPSVGGSLAYGRLNGQSYSKAIRTIKLEHVARARVQRIRRNWACVHLIGHPGWHAQLRPSRLWNKSLRQVFCPMKAIGLFTGEETQ
jgi:hypothetical protein